MRRDSHGGSDPLARRLSTYIRTPPPLSGSFSLTEVGLRPSTFRLYLDQLIPDINNTTVTVTRSLVIMIIRI